ncbi:MAG: hypothetical protein OXI44_03495 [Bacteroidota bacterium]|nr:hypothetical protein [Bacteroidota bacterium]
MRENRTSLLAKISPMFTVRTEDVAVEALGYILAGSQPTRDALSQVLRIGGAEVGRIAEIRTQSTGEDGARPDLAAFNENGSECVLIEAKFGAGLTENQPLTYLQRLSKPKTSALLFVAPHARRESLWAQLERRIKESDLGVSFKNEEKQEQLRSATVGEKRWLILTNWKYLLGFMADNTSATGDTQTSADIGQLLGLATHEETTAFMPLRAEELGPDIPRRLMGLNTLIDDATQQLANKGLVSLKGCRVVPQETGYNRYIKLAGAGAAFRIDYKKWEKHRDTPLWLIFYGWENCKPLEEIREKLDSFRQCDPPELFNVGNELVMPIYLPLGQERDAVLDKIVGQLEEIARQIDPAYRS